MVEKNLRLTQNTVKKQEDTESVDDSPVSISSNLEPFANDDLGKVLPVSCPMFVIK